LSRYLDTNTVIALLTADPLTARVNALLRQGTDAMIDSLRAEGRRRKPVEAIMAKINGNDAAIAANAAK
jgi:hypothetical protein